jgi:two-component system, OmpR family, sensor kinase
VPGLRSLRNRLAVIFALIILGAIGTIYLSVTPRLQATLTKQRLDGLATRSRQYAPSVADLLRKAAAAGGTASPRKRAEIIKAARDRKVRRFAEQVSTETLVLAVQKPGPYVVTDSTPDGGVNSADVQAVARQALQTRRLARTTLTNASGRQAVVATPMIEPKGKQRVVPWIVIFADSLSDVQDNVALIRRQVLISGAIALVIAVLAGYLVARALSARVKRLERAARKVASGDFSQPIRADSVDELGRLAAAFDDMQAQLARLDRARKQFIAAASHELRTPIFSLGGFLELLADEDLDEETRRQFLDQIRGQVDRMRNLSVELLDLSRLEAGALELRPEPTDVGQLAREVAAEFTPQAVHHRSDVTLDLRPEPIELDCDPERVAQVLRILLDNALRHTPPGTGVRVSAARDNGHVRLEVSDQGLGIKRQNMPHIFEPFFTSNEEAQGAGLGLAIARELADRMHGRLSVRSAPGQTTFSLDLPT